MAGETFAGPRLKRRRRLPANYSTSSITLGNKTHFCSSSRPKLITCPNYLRYPAPKTAQRQQTEIRRCPSIDDLPRRADASKLAPPAGVGGCEPRTPEACARTPLEPGRHLRRLASGAPVRAVPTSIRAIGHTQLTAGRRSRRQSSTFRPDAAETCRPPAANQLLRPCGV